MRLTLVQVLTRHGDRTSIVPLPVETRAQWAPWLVPEGQAKALAAVAAPDPNLPRPSLIDATREDWHGQLTTQGVAQLVDTGAQLRAWLVDGGRPDGEHAGGALLPVTHDEARRAAAITIRATGTNRTLQSAQALIAGLYPGAYSVAPPAPLPVEVRQRARESMFPNPGLACARHLELLRSLDADAEVLAAERAAWERAPLAELRAVVHDRNVAARARELEEALAAAEAQKVAEESADGSNVTHFTAPPSTAHPSERAGETTVASVSEPIAASPRGARTEDGVDARARALGVPAHLLREPRQPSATAVWEPLQARANHGLPLPSGVDATDLATVRRAAEVRHILRASNAEAAALAGGRLLKELADEIEDVVGERANQRLSVYSGHDASIIALLAAMGAFEGEWPPVASTVVVETWRGGGGGRGGARWSTRSYPAEVRAGRPEADAMVRVVFNGRVIDLPGCAEQEPLHRGGLCPLEAFVAMADRKNPRNYEEACKLKGKRGRARM